MGKKKGASYRIKKAILEQKTLCLLLVKNLNEGFNEISWMKKIWWDLWTKWSQKKILSFFLKISLREFSWVKKNHRQEKNRAGNQNKRHKKNILTFHPFWVCIEKKQHGPAAAGRPEKSLNELFPKICGTPQPKPILKPEGIKNTFLPLLRVCEVRQEVGFAKSRRLRRSFVEGLWWRSGSGLRWCLGSGTRVEDRKGTREARWQGGKSPGGWNNMISVKEKSWFLAVTSRKVNLGVCPANKNWERSDWSEKSERSKKVVSAGPLSRACNCHGMSFECKQKLWMRQTAAHTAQNDNQSTQESLIRIPRQYPSLDFCTGC